MFDFQFAIRHKTRDCSTGGVSININDYPVLIGENAEKPERFWNGLIDDVRVYSYGLSADEVAAIYAGQAEQK